MGKRQDRRRKIIKQQRLKRLIIISSIIIGAFILFLLIISPTRKVINNPIIIPENHERPMAHENIMGNPDSPVKITEFSSYTCGHCASFALDTNTEGATPTETLIINNYIKPGLAYFIYIPFGWTENSNRATEATYCAMEQGKFWEYRDIIYANLGNEEYGEYSIENLLLFAENLSLDSESFQQCLNSGKYVDQVEKNNEYGRQVGVTATPSFLVNDTLVFASKLINTIENELNSRE